MLSRHANSESEPLPMRTPAGMHRVVGVRESEEHIASRTLSPMSPSAMNSLRVVTNSEEKLPTTSNSMDHKSDEKWRTNGTDVTAVRSTERIEASLSPQNSNGPRLNGIPTSHSHAVRVSPISTGSLVRTISSEFDGPSRLLMEENTAPQRDVSPQPWSSAVGRAQIGKSGRVIEKLMSENDSLKREMKILRAQAEESRSDLKIVQSKMDTLQEENTKAAHQVDVVESLLKRKERQLGELKSSIDSERRKAETAMESERSWKEIMEKMEVETKHKVEDAETRAIHMESQYKTLSGHWKDQDALLNSKVAELNAHIAEILEQRIEDRGNMSKLEATYEQQAQELRNLQSEKEAIGMLFESYKAEQDAALVEIKSRAREQERTYEAAMEEAQQVLGEMRWVMNVKRDVRKME